MTNDYEATLNSVRPTRPQLYDEPVRRAAVLTQLDVIYAWGENDYDDETETRERIVTTVADAIDGEHDAYRACRQLERDGYESDAQLVELVSQVIGNLYAVWQDAERAWVRDTGGPAREFAVGDRVTWHRIRMKTAGTYTGDVVKIDTARAVYHVFCEELGHVRPGERRSGTLASVVNFEDAWAAQPVKADVT